MKDPADPFAGFSDTPGQRRVIQPQKIIQKEEREKGSASDKRKRRGPALLASVLGPQGSSPIGPEDQNAGPHHHGFSSPIDLMNERRDRRQTEKAIGGGKNLVIEPSGDPEEVARYHRALHPGRVRPEILEHQNHQHGQGHDVIHHRPEHRGRKHQKRHGQDQQEGHGRNEQPVVPSDSDGPELVEQQEKEGEKEKQRDEVQQREPDG